MSYRKFKWLYFLVVFIIGNESAEEPIGFVSDYFQFLLVISFIFIIIMKLITIERKRDDFGFKFYLIEVVEAFLLFMIMALILNEFEVIFANAIIIETIIFLFIGYFDFFFSKRINNDYPIDKLGMYSVLAIVYILAEFSYFDLQNLSGLRNSIAFIIFMDLFIMILIHRFKKSKVVLNPLGKLKNDSYLTLSPKKDIEYSPYFEMLEFGVKNEDVRNIAVTSIYGGGKSSVIESYLNKMNRNNHIQISLAHFDDNIDTDNILNTLQLKIIKHLFFKVDPKRLPKSTYVRKAISAVSIGINIFFAYLIYILVILISTNFFNSKVEIDMSNIALHFVPALIVLVFLIIKASPLKLQKIDTKIGTFLLGDKEDESTFDKYIEELVYFFKATKYTIVLLEDIDRFRDISIFNALRELNILLNESEEITSKITFIYAMNDYLIEEENKANRKTKFFDLIVPIIPISSNYNTSGILVDFLEDKKLTLQSFDRKHKEELSVMPSTTFLERLSFYIGDMRTVKNIVNEYIITLEAFNNNQGVDISNIRNKHFLNKLFSIIVYKNFMPKDYSCLYDGQGVVFTFINEASEFSAPLEGKLVAEQEKLKKEKEYLDTYGISSSLLDNIISNHYRITQPGVIYNIFESKDSVTSTGSYNTNTNTGILSKLQGKHFKVNNRGNLRDFDSEVENFLKIGESNWYSVTITDRNKIGTEIYKIENKLAKLKYMKLSEIIIDIPSKKLIETYAELDYIKATKIDTVLNKDNYIRETKNKIPEILLFLLKNGYIAEDYDNYMNYYIKGKKTDNDRRFIQSLYSGEPIKSDLNLNDFEGILRVIKPEELKSKTAHNFSLFDFLLKNEMYDLLLLIFENIGDNSSLMFLREYISVSKEPELLINYLLKNQSEFIDLVLNIDSHDEYTSDIVINLILMYSTSIGLDKILSEDTMDRINNFSKIILYNSEVENTQVQANIKRNLKIIDVKFKVLLDSQDNNDLLGFIYINDLYDLNYNIVKKILENNLNSEVIPTYYNIISNKLDILRKYASDNIEDFVIDVLLSNETPKKESSDSIIEILNNPKLSNNIGKDLLSSDFIVFEVDNLSLITDKSYYNDLLRYNKIKHSVENLDIIFDHITSNITTELYSELAKFILVDIDLLSLKENDALAKKINTNLSKLITSKGTSDDNIKKLLKDGSWDFTFIKSLPEEILVLMVRENTLSIDTFEKIIDINVMLSIIYKASAKDGVFSMQHFQNSMRDFDYGGNLNDFIKTLTNKDDQKELIIEYFEELDEKFLFELIPEPVRTKLLENRHVAIETSVDWYYIVEIGEKLNWFRQKYKNSVPSKIIPRPSHLIKFK